MDPIARVREVCLGQHDVISRSQAMQVGMSKRQIDARLAATMWVPIERGVFLTRPGSVSLNQRTQAALLHAGESGMISGRHAMTLNGVRVPAPPPIAVIVPHGTRRNSTPTTQILRTRDLLAPVIVRGFPCAPLDRAVLDAAWLGTTINEVREVIAAAVQQGRSDPRALFVAALHRGRIPALVRAGLEEILNGARSVPEAEVVRRMARANITGLRFNARVYDGSRFLCSPDVLDEDSWTALEIDSIEYHLSPEAYRRTQERRRRAIAAGLIVVSATPSEIYRDFDGVLESFGAAIVQGRSRILPSNLRVA